MSRYRVLFAWIVAALGGLVAFDGVGQGSAGLRQAHDTARSLPNVVLVVMDALRADRVHATRNGVPLMPYLSRLAEESVKFPKAVTPGTNTRFAMSCIFTSLYVDTHQVRFYGDVLSDSMETMAAFLKKTGYATLAVQTNHNLAADFGFAQGFDQYQYFDRAEAAVVTAHALDLVQSPAQPFFLYVHYLDPHPPWSPPGIYRTLLGYPDPRLDPAERAIAEDFAPYFWDHVDYRMGLKPAPEFPPLSPLGQEAVRTLCDADVLYTDYEAGLLLDAIPARYPNTIVIVIADHGEHLWEHGHLGHGLTMYEPVLRVLFFMKGPGLSPRTIADNVSTIDLLPTVAALLGLPPRPAWQGRSLFAPRDPLAPVFSHTYGPQPKYNTDLEMVMVGATKLILNRRSGQAELYDGSLDPGETTDLSAQRPQQVEQLKAMLDTHHQQNIEARAGAPANRSPS